MTRLVQRERKTGKENRKEMERGLTEGVDFVASKRANLAELTWWTLMKVRFTLIILRL